MSNLNLNAAISTFLLSVVLMMPVNPVAAQVGPRPLVPPSGPGYHKGTAGEKIDKGDAAGDVVRIRKFAGAGRQTMEKTPEYKHTASRGIKPAGDWAQVTVTYDTTPEWIDELVFQYYVLTLKVEDGKKAFSFFKTTVKYADIERGREHLSSVYLRPATLKRYGSVVASAVEISFEGKPVCERTDVDPEVKLPERWWTKSEVVESKTVTTRDGYLLDRSQTPFAFVNIDDYEVSK